MVVRKRLKISGPALVFVTTTVNNWIPIFRDERITEAIVDQLKEALDHFQTSLVGYVIMPTHLHLLLRFPDGDKLSQFMQSFKILTGKTVKGMVSASIMKSLSVNSQFRLWKPRFDDLIIISEHQFKVKPEYIPNNPVRAGLVTKASDWKYSSASDWLEDRPGLLPIDKDFSWAE